MEKGVSKLDEGRETLFRLSLEGQLIGRREELPVTDPAHKFKNGHNPWL